jgi:hypothetical protein
MSVADPSTVAVIVWNTSCRSRARAVNAITTAAPTTAPAQQDTAITVGVPRRRRFANPARPPTYALSTTVPRPLKPTTRKPIAPAATVAVITTRIR